MWYAHNLYLIHQINNWAVFSSMVIIINTWWSATIRKSSKDSITYNLWHWLYLIWKCQVTKLSTIHERYQKLLFKFALKCTKSEKVQDILPLSTKSTSARNQEKYQVPMARKQRYFKSAVPTMARMLNNHTWFSYTICGTQQFSRICSPVHSTIYYTSVSSELSIWQFIYKMLILHHCIE